MCEGYDNHHNHHNHSPTLMIVCYNIVNNPKEKGKIK